jgi:glycosyltransferase involved in cell wall biosynthesis
VRIALKVPLSPFIGYGNDGIGIATELDAYGADVHIVPGAYVDSPLPQVVADLFTKDKLDRYDLTLHHMDPDNFRNPEGWEETAGLKVGWTMWEFSNFLNLATHETLRERLEPYDVFLAYDEVTAGALREYFDGEIRVLQGGFLPENHTPIERDWHDPDHFRFCMVGQLHDRKDPFVAIQAFNELKHEYPEEFAGAELHLKNSIPGAFPVAEVMNETYAPVKIRIYNDIWDKETLDMFYANMHVLLAPSRGEGKNLPALEFQSTGGAVIATNWGGHTQWLNRAYNYPLDYTLHPVDIYENRHTLNARASKEHLKELMLHVYRNRAEVKQKAQLASSVIPQAHSWEAVIRRMFSVLGEIDPKIEALASIARTENGYGS